LDEIGIAIDFKVLKKAMVVILEPFDHALVLDQNDPLITSEVLLPHTQRLISFDGNPSAENLAGYALDALRRLVPQLLTEYDASGSLGVKVAQIKLWETESCFVVVS